MSTTAPRADAAAASVGARDLFVLRRVTGNRFVHFGGSGRGAGWAGLIEVSTDEEVSLGEALTTRSTVRLAHGGKELVFGPYYARAAAFVPVTNDVVVVFGGEDDALDDGNRRRAAVGGDAGGGRGRIGHAREAARRRARGARGGALGRGRAGETTWQPSMRALGLIAARVTLVRGGRGLPRGGRAHRARRPRLGAARAGRRGRVPRWQACSTDGRFPYCVQDASIVPLPSPLDEEPGIRSYYLLELHGLARACCSSRTPTPAPRGFTLLCRRLGLRLADVASAQLGVALTREWCSTEADRLHSEFGKLDAS